MGSCLSVFFPGYSASPDAAIGHGLWSPRVSHSQVAVTTVSCQSVVDGSDRRTADQAASSGSRNVTSLDGVFVEQLLGEPVSSCQVHDIVRALFDFYAVNEDDLSFEKGDRLNVDVSTTGQEWLLAKNVTTGKRGYIPSNHVCADNSLQAHDWWLDGDRAEAELLLLLPGNPEGTFLVREAKDKRFYVLSVRHKLPQSGDPAVQHYLIKQLVNGHFYIHNERDFKDIPGLVNYYSYEELGNLLTRPCPRLRPDEGDRGQPLEISRSAITLDNELGSGHYGQVWKGKLHGRVEVAVKTLKMGNYAGRSRGVMGLRGRGRGGGHVHGDDVSTCSAQQQQQQQLVLREADFMRRLRHPRLVRLLGVCSGEGQPVWLVMELMPNGALKAFLREPANARLLSPPCLVKMAAQIADGMHYLESRNFVHRDLRAANVLVGKYYDVKVADFGLARMLESSPVYKASTGSKVPLKWTAPEATQHEGAFSVKSDVWSFGVLLYELFTFGREPYPAHAPHQVLQAVIRGYIMPKPEQEEVECPNSVYDIMLRCWHLKPAKRPSFLELKTFFYDFRVGTGALDS